MPVDPGGQWLPAGVTGLARQREWDAVVTVAGPGVPGEEAQLVVLPDGRVLVEEASAGTEPASFVAALGGAIAPPYRAVAVRRPDVWAVGAVAIEVTALAPEPSGRELSLTWDGQTLTLARDGLPADPSGAAALAELAGERMEGPYAARARRLDGTLWEVSVLPL